MKLNELISGFEIYTNNEEKRVLESLDSPCYIESFSPRDQIIIDNLVRKSLVSKIRKQNGHVVIKNEF